MSLVPPEPEGHVDPLVESCATLPPLPPVIHYFDDYGGVERSIVDYPECDSFKIEIDGKTAKIHLDMFGRTLPIMKHIFADWFTSKDPTTTLLNINACMGLIRKVRLGFLERIITLDVVQARTFWTIEAKPATTAIEGGMIRAMLHSMCNLAIGAWSPLYRDIIRALPGHPVDRYRTIRAGDCFLPLSQQARVVEYFDNLALLVHRSPSSIDYEELRDACVLLTIFQYAFQPGQVARIEVADVRVIADDVVHISVVVTKQKDLAKRQRVARRVKREWAPLVKAFLERREARGDDAGSPRPSHLLFQLTPFEVSQAVNELCHAITGDDWTPTDLRHSAAQRMADAGVSRIALSEFLTHAGKHTANVYFDSSPTQAKRVNEAMAISPIYANVAKIVRTRTVDKEMLLRLPEDNQVAGVPHGIPIAGVGACGLGQSLCPKSPVLSCYNCRQFMPLRDPEIHKTVLRELRPVVADFASLSTNAAPSPAFTQLRSTLDAVRRVVDSLESKDEEE